MQDHAPDDAKRLPLEYVIKKLTGDNVDLYGFRDRGRPAVGRRADLNLFDTVQEELKALDIDFVAPPNMFDGPRGSKIGVLCFCFKDPDGTVLELISSDIEATMVSA